MNFLGTIMCCSGWGSLDSTFHWSRLLHFDGIIFCLAHRQLTHTHTVGQQIVVCSLRYVRYITLPNEAHAAGQRGSRLLLDVVDLVIWGGSHPFKFRRQGQCADQRPERPQRSKSDEDNETIRRGRRGPCSIPEGAALMGWKACWCRHQPSSPPRLHGNAAAHINKRKTLVLKLPPRPSFIVSFISLPSKCDANFSGGCKAHPHIYVCTYQSNWLLKNNNLNKTKGNEMRNRFLQRSEHRYLKKIK